MHSKVILRNLDSQNSLFNVALILPHDIQLHADTVHCTVPGASAQTEEVHEEEIESGVEEKEEEEGEGQEVEDVIEEEEVVVTSSDEDEDAEEISQE